MVAKFNGRHGIGLRRLRCSVQNYDWGKLGTDSQVARLYKLNSGSKIQLDKSYAELWMGTHESEPSFVVDSSEIEDGAAVGPPSVTLKKWIAKNPNVLGDKVLDKWGCDLPFLFKVLSISKALSIQAHPDKELAKMLHKLQPDVYKDENHKPEMALAITKFEALCGFINTKELKAMLQNIPEIVELVGKADTNKYLSLTEKDKEEKVKSVLRSMFTQLMATSKEVTTEVISKLKNRLHVESQVRQLTDKEQLVLRLEKLYPADIGVFAAFFFNYVKLNPGEALYLGENEPHAYIYGECIECMATSDNVVRAGLTPKFRDIQTLCSMLTYKQGQPEILKGFPLNSYVTKYMPPFDEFEVDCCILPAEASTVFPAIPGPSIFIIIAGEGEMQTGSSNESANEGDVMFAPSNIEITVTTTSKLHLYRAGVNSRFFQMK
ncbi:mannose-6-phosphate isomerase 1-like [Euphorbia lathyris]|uniref:mannose-6-phosphate isomerase 1-like n=1 Tax=Euphorbia lathyris TaxID=212925 RepID=UPI003314405E